VPGGPPDRRRGGGQGGGPPVLGPRPGDHHETRDAPADLHGTSRLSPHLKYGTIHPRQLLARLDGSKGAGVFRTELAWREFYADVLSDRPDSARRALLPAMAGIEVDTDRSTSERFDAWAEGRTGFPFVDAGMRQLLGEGWVHNRVRMVVASFLVKDLHLDWTRGARHFMRHLVDGDLASNQHGWQWTAGTGTDPSPYFRVFNPVSQGKRFDPDGTYVRRWLPELRDVPTRHVHEPWTAPTGPPRGYPPPIVDHAEERAEALRRYDAIR
jgi:deoxyribodipyrimidine photo-lyase